jgi:hypothetical protein
MYLRKFRIAGLAGLASLAVWAIPAAPAGATTTCTTIPTPPYKECTQHVSISVKISVTTGPTGPIVKVTITVADPHLTVKLYKQNSHKKYKFVRTVFNGNVKTGPAKLTIHPKSPGRYELKVKATVPATSTAPAASATVKKFFKVK